MRSNLFAKVVLIIIVSVTFYPLYARSAKTEKPRILISTDIGGTDPDDNQSMIHLLMYNDKFDIEGLVSSPSYGDGSNKEILRMISIYEKDYPKLKKHAKGLLSPAKLRKLCTMGRKGLAPYKGYGEPTDGSQKIVEQARKNDKRPLYVLCWGTLEDVAQALHDAPDIVDKIRVYAICGPNKKWGSNSYAYIAANFPDLWMIENNATYRGFITDGQKTDIYNAGYYDHAMRGAGAMGEDFINYYDGVIKMGDTPSLLYMMDGDPGNPEKDCWGGRFVKTKYTPRRILKHQLTAQDTIPCYSVLELQFTGPTLNIPEDSACFTITIDNQQRVGYYIGNGIYCVRYVPKAPAYLTYATSSSIKELDGLSGEFIVSGIWIGKQHPDDYVLGENWYTDSPDTDLFEGQWHGAKSIRRWQPEILDDWTVRWSWLK